MNPYRHFILYAKRHYHRTNLIMDLTKILSNYNDMPVDCQPTGRALYSTLVLALESACEPFLKDVVQFAHYRSCIRDNIIDGGLNVIPIYDAPTAYINAMLKFLAHHVDNTMITWDELGEPDPSVLELSRKG